MSGSRFGGENKKSEKIDKGAWELLWKGKRNFGVQGRRREDPKDNGQARAVLVCVDLAAVRGALAAR